MDTSLKEKVTDDHLNAVLKNSKPEPAKEAQIIQRRMGMEILVGLYFVWKARKYRIIYTNHSKGRMTCQLDSVEAVKGSLPIIGSTIEAIGLKWLVIHIIPKKNRFIAEAIKPEKKGEVKLRDSIDG